MKNYKEGKVKLLQNLVPVKIKNYNVPQIEAPIGRNIEIQKVVEGLLKNEVKFVNVYGLEGIGKSTVMK